MEKVFDMKELKKRDGLATKTASIHGVTPTYVRLIIRGERTNESILNTYTKLKNAEEALIRELTNQES